MFSPAGPPLADTGSSFRAEIDKTRTAKRPRSRGCRCPTARLR